MEKYIDLNMLDWIEMEGGNNAAIINRAEFQEQDIRNLIWLAEKKKITVVEDKERIIFID